MIIRFLFLFILSLEYKLIPIGHLAIWKKIWRGVGEYSDPPETEEIDKARTLCMVIGILVFMWRWIRFIQSNKLPLFATLLGLLTASAIGGLFFPLFYDGWLLNRYKRTRCKFWLKPVLMQNEKQIEISLNVFTTEVDLLEWENRYKLTNSDLALKAGVDYKRL